MNDRPSSVDDAVRARLLLDELDAARRQGSATPVSFGRLYRFATSSDPDDSEIEGAIAGDPDLAATLDRLLQRLAVYQMPIAAAAADRASLDRRHGDGWTLQLTPASKGDQLWVIIDFDGGPQPSFLFAGTVRHRLPASDNAHIQFRVDGASSLAAAIREPSNAIYLV